MQRLLLVCLFIVGSCSKGKQETPPHSFPVKVATVKQETVPVYLETIGHVEPILTADITSRVEGEILEVFFEEGQKVEEGSLLFTIDPKPFQASLEKAKAKLEQDLAILQLSEEKVTRYQDLVKEAYVSQFDFDSFVSEYKQNQSLIAQDEANLLSAKINLDYCYLYAPFSGKMGILKIDRGNLIKTSQNQVLVTINQIAPIYVTFSISENELARVRHFYKKEPLKVTASFESFSTPPLEGTLQIIDNQVDSKTGMVKMRALFTNEEEILWPNQFVSIRLYLTEEKEVLTIPSAAILKTTEGEKVFVLEKGDKVSLKTIKVGLKQNGIAVVKEGLKKEEIIITEGQENLSSSSLVTVKNKV